jgi:hypothetical protein
MTERTPDVRSGLAGGTARRLLAIATGIVAVVIAGGAAAQDPADRIATARARLAAIEARASGVADINALENLQRSYGYYVDKMLWEQVLDLFTDDATLEIGLSGVYHGKASIRDYLYDLSGGVEGPLEGVLYDHMQLQPVITLADDGLSAKARWRALLLTGISGSGSGGSWGEGPYENEYVKEDGVWKISKLHWYATFIAPYEGGWLNANADAVRQYSVAPNAMPDEPPSENYAPYPGVYVPEFSFANPVSGE